MTEARAVLVTGSTGGIGMATVRLLQSRGFTVYAGARGPAAFEPGVRVVPLDVADPESVAAAAKRVAGEVDGLWAVINNAGVIVQGPLELVPADEWRRQLEVNTLGPASVVREFLPLVRAGHGRIVNVSAATGRVAMPLLGALSASKAGLEALSNALRLELAAWKIPVVVVEPGTTETEIFARAGAAADAAMQQADRERVELYAEHLAAYGKAMGRFKPGPVEKVAEVIVRAVEARRPRRRYAVAEARTLGAILPKLPAGLRDRVVGGAVGLNGIKP
ncbi:SDR family NAD(P)-dependent oxidoreductase [Kribbella pratensis]|uniref:Short-subunit dehydrogenase n=1 Tax=Kribbella pratensis TaxID=2512112 RepID=A0A4R8BTR0_9ACTN|nr:SDR family NAD(P)-dependent oxidoreductase [Kribbella pratensis]TDW60940.1 short-subunit dehydrogenase [Kribbella pratensis]